MVFKDTKLDITGDYVINPESGDQIMMSWEHPIMKTHADIVTMNGGDILEVGFGLGISATYIQEHDIDSHDIIEINDMVFENAKKWAEKYPKSNLIQGDFFEKYYNLMHFQIEPGKKYDGIFYDGYGERYDGRKIYKIFEKLLKPGGILTYFNQSKPPKNAFNIPAHLVEYIEVDITNIDIPDNCRYFDMKDVYYANIIKFK
jgi:hypothetical protein